MLMNFEPHIKRQRPRLDEIKTVSHSSMAWFYIDIKFYVTRCLLAGIALDSTEPDYIIRHFCSAAGQLALSPNPFFDEPAYIKRYQWVTDDIKAGRCRSGFEHYMRHGAAEHTTPHWNFEPHWYLRRNPDINDKTLELLAYGDLYSEYLLGGLPAGRAGNYLFDYNAAVSPAGARLRSAADLRSALVDPKRLKTLLAPGFDTEWFAAKYDMNMDGTGCFDRYRRDVRTNKLSPSPLFDEEFYCRHYPEVNERVEAGDHASGYEHFLIHGRHEFRQPLPNFHPRFYIAANPGVAANLQVSGEDFYAHYARNRAHKALLIEPPFARRHVEEESGKAIFERRAALTAQTTTLPYRPYQGAPDASVIVIAVNKFDETVTAMHSIIANSSCTIEFIVFDNGSNDAMASFAQRFPHIKYIRSDANIGFTLAVNAAAAQATGRHIALLNNDAEVGPGALDRAIATLDSDSTIGAVGGRIIRTHGLLQEGGSLIWRDGTCLGYGRDFDPQDGRVDFVRDVDFCSGCFLVTPAATWARLGGFDPAYAPAYYEETDYCARLWAHGQRVVYDPKILIWHFEFGSSSLRDAPIALMRKNKIYFQSQHKTFLQGCLPAAPEHIAAARLARTPHPRVLFIEDEIPDPTQGMGYVRSTDVVRALEQSAGHLTVCGLHPSKTREAHQLRASLGERTEVLGHINHNNLAAELRNRVGIYDVIWVSRTHNLPHLRELRAEAPAFFKGVRVVLDTEAIASARMAAQARVLDQDFDMDNQLDRELEGLDAVDDICVVNALDRDLVQSYLRRHDLQRGVHILGHAMTPVTSLPRYEDTADIALVGSFFSANGPNADGARWFDQHVVPLLAERLSPLPLLLAGYNAEALVTTLKRPAMYRVMSDLSSMAPVYRTARVIAAPTRFAGGIPYKVHEAAAHGVPVVMTSLLGSQLGWDGDAALGIVKENDAEAFASMIVELYQNNKAWSRCQKGQIEWLESDCRVGAFNDCVDRLVKMRAIAD
jgi:GT2 family glycosyltransferase